MLTTRASTFGGLMALALLLGAGCTLPWEPPDDPSSASVGTTLPTTADQQALVRRYIDLIAAEQYAEAWTLLTPRRQRRESIDRFASGWRDRGRLSPDPNGGPFIWPAAVDEVRADVWLQRSDTYGGMERVSFELELEGGWWITEEHRRGHRGRDADVLLPPDASVEGLVRRYVAENYGPLWLSTLEILHQEPFAEDRGVIFRVLNPLLAPRDGTPRSTAILLLALRRGTVWEMAGGGSIGTIAVMDEHAVSCAWTWLRWIAGAPSMPAFYCTVEDPRVATIELVRADGGVQRSDVAGQRAAVFPYRWDDRARWPAQQPRAIRLFDAAGRLLDLPTPPLRERHPIARQRR